MRGLPFVATVALLVWLALRIDLGAVWDAARTLPPVTLAGLLLLSCGFNLVIYTDRWRRTLKALGIEHSFRRVLQVHLGTGALRLAMPIHTGEFVNAAVLARAGPGSFGQHVGAIAYLKFLNLIATLALAACGWALGSVAGESSIVRSVLVSSLVLIPAFLPEIEAVRRVLGALAGCMHPRLGEVLRDLLIVYREAAPGAKLFLLGYSVVFQLSEVIVCHLLLRALGIELGFADTLLVAPLLMLVVSVPVTLAGIGVREASALLLLAPYAPEVKILAFGLSYSLIEYVAPLVVGLPWVPRTLAELAGRGRAEAS